MNNQIEQINELAILEEKSINLLGNFQKGTIDIDLECLIEPIKTTLKPFELSTVENDKVKEAKKELARIRGLKTGLDIIRKKYKEKYLEPLLKFEHEFNKVTGLFEASISNIKFQVDNFEHQEKILKRDKILKKIDRLKEENGVDYDIKFSEKWLNKTYKWSTIEEDIIKQFEYAILKEKAYANTPKVDRTLKFTGLTKDMMLDMLDYFDKNGIKFEVLKDEK